MRIAFVSTVLGYPWGGADTLWTQAAEAASARGDQLLLSLSPAVTSSRRIANLLNRGALLHTRTTACVPHTLYDKFAAKLKRALGHGGDGLVGALEAFRPDLVIISLGGTYDLILHPDWVNWFDNSGTKVRLIANWQEENPYLITTNWHAAKRALRVADKVYFVSSRNLDVTRRHLLEPLLHARVIQNPLRWQPSDVSPWPDLAPTRLATVSRLDEGKGIQLALHALATLPDDMGWRLNIYGKGPAESYLRATTAHLQLDDLVNFRGHVDSLREIWADNHLLLSPSLEDGVPMTIPEAMLCARPVLSTTVGGASDWLTDGVTGYLSPAPTLPLLAETLRRALAISERARWPEVGRAAAAAAHAKYIPQDYLTLLS